MKHRKKYVAVKHYYRIVNGREINVRAHLRRGVRREETNSKVLRETKNKSPGHVEASKKGIDPMKYVSPYEKDREKQQEEHYLQSALGRQIMHEGAKGNIEKKKELEKKLGIVKLDRPEKPESAKEIAKKIASGEIALGTIFYDVQQN